MSFTSIDVETLAILLQEEDAQRQFIDVREPEEANIAFISRFQLLPLSQSQQWIGDISLNFNPEWETIVICHHGIRSAHMCQWLVSQGFINVKNVTGGINAYSVLIDPSLPRY